MLKENHTKIREFDSKLPEIISIIQQNQNERITQCAEFMKMKIFARFEFSLDWNEISKKELDRKN